MLKVTHTNAGFFSCCSKRLDNIVEFINKNKKLPEHVDSSEQFSLYKTDDDKERDITFDYFQHYHDKKNIEICIPITYNHNLQYKNYANLDYKGITQLIKIYFSPSVEIKEIIDKIEKKYKLNYDNICVLFHRGNDKNRETKKSDYDKYLTYANEIIKQNPAIMFLIQSDETEFIEFMTNQFPNNSLYFKDEIRHIKKCDSSVDKLMKSQNYEFSKKYVAITIIMSKCKYIICGSGNCDIWIMLYRGNNKNVIQNITNRRINFGWNNTVF